MPATKREQLVPPVDRQARCREWARVLVAEASTCICGLSARARMCMFFTPAHAQLTRMRNYVGHSVD